MKREELDNLIKEETKWLLESEWENAVKEGKELFLLQQKIFSPMFNSIISQSHNSLSTEDAKNVIKLITKFTTETNGAKFNVLICFLSFIFTECLRLSPLCKGDEEQ